MRIIFMGTPEPAAKCLKAIIDSGEEIVGVVTQPDRPKGRGLKLTPSPVKEYAVKHRIKVFEPEKLKDKMFISELKSLDAALIVVVAYGKILPKEILILPPYGCINVHASILPKYRGAAPIQWAIMNGEKETGVTVFKLKETLDTGDILLQKKVVIDDKDNSKTLYEKIFNVASEVLLETIKKIKSGKVEHVKQNDVKATYAPALKKESGIINWEDPAVKIHNKIRALNPWPGAYTYYKGKILKVWESEVTNDPKYKPVIIGGKWNKVLEIVKNKGFVVGTSDGALLVKEVQPQSGKRMSAYQFAIGHDLKVGETLPS